ncbi:MAG: BamA/TamA family outer membrane protein [Deltaproteobacteria bacterium]|nr:BamA/TamA family outer membrane protein [Deltaproteobacteria bacterium]
MTSLARPRAIALFLAFTIVGTTSVHAQPAPPPPEPAPTPAPPAPEPTPPKPEPAPEATPDAKPGDTKPADAKPGDDTADAKPDEPDWSSAPRPDQSRGVVHEEAPALGDRLRWVPRVVLFVPRWVFWVAMQPVRFTAYVYERYNLPGRLKATLFNVEETFGIYPVLKYDTAYGFTAGIRIVHRDMFGARERLRLGADFGGEFRQAVSGSLRSGKRFGERFTAELSALYERRPGERFYGIGNGEKLANRPSRLIDPSIDDTAYPTRFHEDLARVLVAAEGHATKSLTARVTGAFVKRDFGRRFGDLTSIERIYLTSQLAGYDSGVDNIYVEGDVTYDTRRPTSRYHTQIVDATGWFVNAHVGGAKGVGGDPTDYYRYGAEVQRYFDLYQGNRVLALRAIVDSVGGTDGRADGEIPFVELPRLGGAELLRGFPHGRFRDRATTLVSAEYTWDLSNHAAAYVFADAGRAWRSLRDVQIDNSLRVGYGGGIQLHTSRSFLMRVQVAASEENLLFELKLSPAYGRRERAGRY